ncbi:PA domain-containing protein [Propionicimonas paludicola]|uniref:PA domain-containing protein n=1 Tax=Propionicimonas paludicola TaxID=185243 RepID=A0A2A9CWH4_9ACTN|nr:PA domain-containing protein [Propionicimonas paludicola]
MAVQPKLPVLIATATALALAASAVPAHAETRSGADSFVRMSTDGPIGTTFTPRSLDGSKKVDVMVQLTGDPVAVVQAKAGGSLTGSQRTAVKAKLRKAQDALTGEITAGGGKVVAKLQSAYNGIRVRIARNKAAALAGLPGVTAVHALTPKSLNNTVSVPFLGVPQAWQATGKTGKGVKVAVIDTGIDYTHADFGGPGTVAAYTAARANSAATLPTNSTLFGPSAPRVKGGYDFAGDGYDADGTTGSATPTPDANPLDCEGHGTHVAGTTGGGGVTASGAAYTGPYDESTPSKKFTVGPGVAPEVDLYALKVFGCTGTTDLSVQAIDWAVDHQMDVINLSLGAPFGQSDDPDAVAAANAVAAGVVVVASAGNEGGNPYLVGSPAVGKGVIGVAAVDSAETFPGAELSVGSTSVQAINANDAALPSGTLKLVNIPDQPGTADVNESLGCSVESFTAAGIKAGENQIAVVERGSCARAAKAIFGQKAGAAAVVMTNTDPGFPPFEGKILSNPDDGEAYQVTIPFLGVTSDGGATLADAEGAQVGFSASTVTNPVYRAVADFSSAGPSTTESGLSPNVAAPGVSIFSAAVGTGSDGQVESGTSMAAPHVAGVAALAVQAHPNWTASQVAAAVVGTADADKVAGYQVTQSGTGLVDALQAINTQTVVTGDSYRTSAGKIQEASLSFGFAEPSLAYVGAKSITISNLSDRPVTYRLSTQAGPQSRPASMVLGTKKLTVKARSQATVPVLLSVPAASIGTSLSGEDQFSFRQVSGAVVVSSSAGELKVPYLLVPRAQARLDARLAADKQLGLFTAANATPKKGSKPTAVRPSYDLKLKLANFGGALPALADIYTWGLADKAKDLPKGSVASGYDLRAVGVQSFGDPDDPLMVFAINSHNRWSNAASIEFDVDVDTNRDGESDKVVIGYDSGYIRNGEYNGLMEAFVMDVASGEVTPSGYLAQAPTDSSTILLPVNASQLGLSATSGAFKYTASAYTVLGLGEDSFDGWASYDPFHKPFTDSDQVMVGRNKTAKLTVVANQAAYAAQKPKGLMVVSVDNKSGASEAALLRTR